MEDFQRDIIQKKNSLWMKRKVYKSYLKSAMLYKGKTWYLRENEVAVLKRAEKSMVRAKCSVKLVNKRNIEEQMDMLGLKEAALKLSRTNSMKWYGHVLG